MASTNIWADTIYTETCKDRRCRRRVVFAQNVRTGRFMPFDAMPTPIAVQAELETGREQWTVSTDGSHFITCPGRLAFRKPR